MWLAARLTAALSSSRWSSRAGSDAEGFAFGGDEGEVVVEVVAVAADEVLEGLEASFGVDELARPGVGGEGAEEGGGHGAVELEEFGGGVGVELVVVESLGEEGFVVAEDERAVHGDGALHALAGDEVAVHEVEDDLLDGPGVGDGEGGEGVAGKAFKGAGGGGGALLVAVDDVGVHGRLLGCASVPVTVLCGRGRRLCWGGSPQKERACFSCGLC